MFSCPNCQQVATFNHIHNAAHGIPGTHMDGTERYVCSLCSHAIFKEEGERLGLTFTLD